MPALRAHEMIVIDHCTAANFSPFYGVARLDWVDDLAPGIISRDQLPRLLWSTEIAGQITPAAAAKTGLAIGTPVTSGTIDAAAEAVSGTLTHWFRDQFAKELRREDAFPVLAAC